MLIMCARACKIYLHVPICILVHKSIEDSLAKSYDSIEIRVERVSFGDIGLMEGVEKTKGMGYVTRQCLEKELKNKL